MGCKGSRDDGTLMAVHAYSEKRMARGEAVMDARLRGGCEEGRQAASSSWKRPGTASLSLRDGSGSTVLEHCLLPCDF